MDSIGLGASLANLFTIVYVAIVLFVGVIFYLKKKRKIPKFKITKIIIPSDFVRKFEEIVNQFRKEIPGISISTDIIVGYPTETEDDFRQTVEMVKRLKFEVMNISKFASRTGTRASKLKQLKTHDIKRRSIELTNVYNEIKQENKEIKKRLVVLN